MTTIVGTGASETLTGTDETDYLYGQGGADTITGNGLSDFLYGDDGQDWVFGGNGADYIHGGNGSDILFGGSTDAGSDTVYGDGSGSSTGQTGDDQIYVSDGADYVEGGGGDDTIGGGTGSDIIYGDLSAGTQYGSDQIFGSSGNDSIYSGQGQDLVYSGIDDDYITFAGTNGTFGGGAGDDNISSAGGYTASGNTIYGGSGHDVISGYQSYSNKIWGGADADQINLYDYDSADRIFYQAGQTGTGSNYLTGSDTINGFEHGVDIVDLSFYTIDSGGTSRDLVSTDVSVQAVSNSGGVYQSLITINGAETEQIIVYGDAYLTSGDLFV
jgi:Ca2+-binding RTX toxin-like protein